MDGQVHLLYQYERKTSFIDALFALTQNSEYPIENDREINQAFLDQEKALDSVNRDHLLKVLERYGV